MSDAEILGPNDPGPRDAKDANYSTSNNGANGGTNGGSGAAAGKSFPWERLALTVVFAFVAWCVFWLSLLLALIAGGLKLFGVQTQENIAALAAKTSGYLGGLLAYVSGSSDDKPFPFG